MPVLATLVHVRRGNDILLLLRKKPPFVGYWIAPGGKMEPDEAPFECALRELHEETGLVARHALLRSVTRETSPLENFDWLIFTCLVEEFSGELFGDEREGRLQWWSLDQLDNIRMPEADRVLLPHALAKDRPIAEFHFLYDQDLQIMERRALIR